MKETFGYVVYFELALCDGYQLIHLTNPVEAYKQNMLALLVKPGYEDKKKNLEERL